MGHEFEVHHEFDTDATVEQVWQAIATGEGVTSWFMGRTEVAPGEDGEVRTEFGDLTMASRITGWQPPTRFTHRSPTGDDGRFIAYEFLVEGRDQGSTVVRVVTSGFLPGDDWRDEYDAMTKGLDTFTSTLAEYLAHFAGRRATAVTAFGPPVSDWPAAWRQLRRALGLGTRERVAPGDRVRCSPADLPDIDGTVYHVNPHAVAVRTDDALYRFLHGFGGQLVASHHLFTPTDPGQATRAWRTWLEQLDQAYGRNP